MMSAGKRLATIAAEVTVPEVSRMRRFSARSLSIRAAAASTSPTLAPWIQTSGPCGRTSLLMPRRSPTRAGSSLPCCSRRLISAGASGTIAKDSFRYTRSVIGSELAMTRLFRAADLGIGAAGGIVQSCFQLGAQFFHGLGIGVGWNRNYFAAHQCTSTEWQIDGGAVPVPQAYETAGRHGERHDRPPGLARQ